MGGLTCPADNIAKTRCRRSDLKNILSEYASLFLLQPFVFFAEDVDIRRKPPQHSSRSSRRFVKSTPRSMMLVISECFPSRPKLSFAM